VARLSREEISTIVSSAPTSAKPEPEGGGELEALRQSDSDVVLAPRALYGSLVQALGIVREDRNAKGAADRGGGVDQARGEPARAGGAVTECDSHRHERRPRPIREQATVT